MRSLPAFLAVAAAVTLTPGPAFALLLRVSVRHGRRAALANIAGNSLGVLVWGALAALGVSALVTANQVAYDALRGAGVAFLLWLGVRALLGLGRGDESAADAADRPPARSPAAMIVAFDVLWYGSVALVVDRFRELLRPRLRRRLERVSGAVLVAFGLRLATESR